MSKFTFKIHQPTGRFRSFESIHCDVKLKGSIIGSILEIERNSRVFSIGFKVTKKDIMEDKNPNCEWKWVFLKYKPNTLQDAKDFITKHSENIQKQFNLHLKDRE